MCLNQHYKLCPTAAASSARMLFKKAFIRIWDIFATFTQEAINTLNISHMFNVRIQQYGRASTLLTDKILCWPWQLNPRPFDLSLLARALPSL